METIDNTYVVKLELDTSDVDKKLKELEDRLEKINAKILGVISADATQQ